jgi:hypothetical protein
MSIGTTQANTAVTVRDLVIRNDYAALKQIGDDALRALSILLNSDLYGSWPSAKRTEVLNYAVRLGATPPARYRRELGAAGIFVSGVHSIADLLGGLGNRNPATRMAAAETLGAAGKGWTVRPMFRRFQQEVGPNGDHGVAVAIARSMARLGDARAINHYRQQLVSSDGRQASEAARALADIGLRETFEILFWFVASPPPPPGYRNIPVVLSALEAAGVAAVDQLKPMMEHTQAKVRRLMIDVITRCGHSDAPGLLSILVYDADEEVQRAALDALAALNTEASAEALFTLGDEVPRDWVLRALGVMTHPAGPLYARELDASITIVQGALTEDREPLGTAKVQFVQEHLAADKLQNMWRPISARAETDTSGAFTLALFAFMPERTVRLKVTMPIRADGKGGITYLADFPLTSGKVHRLHVNRNRFFDRLTIDVEALPEEA